MDPSLQIDNRIQGSSQAVLPSSKQNKSRAANTRDERFRSGHLLVYTLLVRAFFCTIFFFLKKDHIACFRILFLSVFSDLHTEAVQAALAKYKERKMPMPSKRRSVLVQSSVEACTPPGETLKHAEYTYTHTHKHANMSDHQGDCLSADQRRCCGMEDVHRFHQRVHSVVSTKGFPEKFLVAAPSGLYRVCTFEVGSTSFLTGHSPSVVSAQHAGLPVLLRCLLPVISN